MADSRGRLAATGAVHLWYGRVADPPEQADLLLLDEEEAHQVRSRAGAVRSHYVGAHAALRRILADHYLGGPPAAIRFGRHLCPRCGDTGHGRPRIVSPATGLEFSLSRSGPHWALAVGAGGMLGVDIESRDGPNLEDFVDLVLALPELDRVRAVEPTDDRRDLLLRAWTRKEAVLKAVGVGIVADLRQVYVRPAEAGPLFVEHAESGQRTRWLVEEPDLGPHLAVALARKAGSAGRVVVRAQTGEERGQLCSGASRDSVPA